MIVPEDSSTRSWNAVADDWVAHADTNDYRNHYLMPRTLAMGKLERIPYFLFMRWRKE